MGDHQRKRFKPHGHHHGGHGRPHHRHHHHPSQEKDDYIPETYLAQIRSIGSTAEDIERWRAERRRRFPRATSSADPLPIPQEASASGDALSSLFAAYASEDEDDEDGMDGSQKSSQSEAAEVTQQPPAPLQEEQTSSSVQEGRAKRPCTHFSRFGRCKYGARCHFAHDVVEAAEVEGARRNNTDGEIEPLSTVETRGERSMGHDERTTSSHRKEYKSPSESLMRKLLQDVSRVFECPTMLDRD